MSQIIISKQKRQPFEETTIDADLSEQFKGSLDDLKKRKFKRLA